MASRAKKRSQLRNHFRADSRVAELRPPRAAVSETELLVYGDIGEDFWDEDGGITAKSVKAALDDAPKGSDVVVRINSPGGDAFEGVAIYNVLRDSDRRVVVKVDGTAISAASIIAMAGDEVRMAENALMMIHDPWTIAIGDAGEMRDTADRLDKVAGALAQTYASKTGKPLAAIRDLMAAETWLDAAEALEGGFATHVDSAADTKDQKVAALLTPQRIAAFKRAPAKASRWVNGPVADAAAADPMAGVIVPQPIPPAESERGGSTPTQESTVELSEVQAALNKANETIAKLTDDVSEANARADAIETQNEKLAGERDSLQAKLDDINDARLAEKVKDLVGKRISADEYDDQLTLAKRDEELFDKLISQRTPMTVLDRDPVKAGPDPKPEPAQADSTGSGLANLVDQAANG